MSLPLSTAKAAKTMPQGKGTYGSKKGRPAKKKENPFAKKGAAKKSSAAKKAPAKGAAKKGASKMPPAMLKRMEMMKKKSAKK